MWLDALKNSARLSSSWQICIEQSPLFLWLVWHYSVQFCLYISSVMSLLISYLTVMGEQSLKVLAVLQPDLHSNTFAWYFWPLPIHRWIILSHNSVSEPDISKKYSRPGGIALSEWTRSIRGVRDTQVAADSAPGVNTRRHVIYHPRFAVSPLLPALSVTKLKRTLWRWRRTVTIPRNGFIGHGLASGLQFDGWHYENLSSHSFPPAHKMQLSLTNYTHHSKSPDLCGYWQSIARSICLQSYC